MKAHVYVTLKEEVLDPQGDAVRQALGTLGYQGVKRARVGKLIVLDVDTADRKQAEADLHTMCKKLLSNPVIEDYRFEIVAGS